MATTKLQDIARYAGVSPATVSRVLNNTARVNTNTRERVLAAITKLGYEPRIIPSSTQTDQGSIALIITDILNPFFPEVVRGVEDAAGFNGLTMLLCNTSEDPQRETQALTIVSKRNVSGIIICGSRITNNELISLHETNKVPLVIINRYLNHPQIPCILVDFEDAAYRSTQHLLSLNHTRIAYLAGNGSITPSQPKQRGIEKALAEAHLTLRSEWCALSFPNVEGGFQAMSSLLAQTEKPTAVIAYNDVMALGALHAIRKHGLRVPDDISLIGSDGIAMAAHSNPPLTTINQPKYRMGQLAMEMLQKIIEGNSVPNSGYTLMESPLIVRESTARCTVL